MAFVAFEFGFFGLFIVLWFDLVWFAVCVGLVLFGLVWFIVVHIGLSLDGLFGSVRFDLDSFGCLVSQDSTHNWFVCSVSRMLMLWLFGESSAHNWLLGKLSSHNLVSSPLLILLIDCIALCTSPPFGSSD